MRIKTLIASSILAITLTGCATNPDSFGASTNLAIDDYSQDSCRTLEVNHEMHKRSDRQMYRELKQTHNADTAKAIAGVILWPALIFIEGDSATVPEYQDNKAEMIELERTMIAKNCKIIPQTVKKHTVAKKDKTTKDKDILCYLGGCTTRDGKESVY